MERGKGIEPSALAWKARVLPLYEPRILLGANGQNRTGTPLRNQILSLTCLPISPHSQYYWCPRRDSNSHSEEVASKTTVSTSSTTRALYYKILLLLQRFSRTVRYCKFSKVCNPPLLIGII